MKFFALETDEQKLLQSFLSHDEQVVVTVKYSAFLFVIRTVKSLFWTAVFIAVGATLIVFDTPALWVILPLVVVWFFAIVLKWITAFIDWWYDVLLITTEEIVIVDQSSLFRVHIRQMNLENIASVSAETMYWNLMPFGKLHFELKEGTGKTVMLSYIPQYNKVASIISDTMVLYQRRRAAAMHAIAHGASVPQAEKAAEKAAPAPPPQKITDEGKPN